MLFVLPLGVGCGLDTRSSSKDAHANTEDAPPGCGEQEPDRVALGEGITGRFEAFEAGAAARLQFASQAGLQLPLVVEVRGFSGPEVPLVDLFLTVLVDDVPVGSVRGAKIPLDCIEESQSGLVSISVPLDVGEHPSFSSVVELHGSEAEIFVEVTSEDGSYAESTMQVALEL